MKDLGGGGGCDCCEEIKVGSERIEYWRRFSRMKNIVKKKNLVTRAVVMCVAAGRSSVVSSWWGWLNGQGGRELSVRWQLLVGHHMPRKLA